MTNNKTITTITLLSTTFLAFGLIFAPAMESAFAGEPIIHHGLGAQKGCLKVFVGDDLNCEITATNEDDAGDTVIITDVCDTIAGEGTICMAPGASNGFSILSVADGATCANGNTELPCELPGVAGDDIDGGVVTFASTGFVMNSPGFIDDDALVEWNDSCDESDGIPCNDNVQTSDAPASTLVANPDIEVTKEPHEKAAIGDDIPVSATITNIGDETLVNVGAEDSEAGTLTCGTDELAPTESTECTGSFEAVASGTNVVTASGSFQLREVTAEADQPFTVAGIPDIEVTKECEVVEANTAILWIIDIDNTGDETLFVDADDTRHGSLYTNEELLAGGNLHVEFVEALGPGTYGDTASATGSFQLQEVNDSDTAECTIEERGQEGLTPGYWKANAENWDAGAWFVENPEDDFNTVFGTDVELRLAKGNSETPKGTSEDPTLYGALGARGGDENALARHCVAAKLNTENPDVAYPMSFDSVIEQCSEALNDGTPEEINDLKDLLDEQNNLGADISQHWPDE